MRESKHVFLTATYNVVWILSGEYDEAPLPLPSSSMTNRLGELGPFTLGIGATMLMDGLMNDLFFHNLNSGNWLKVKLISPQGQAGAFGAKTRVYPAGQTGENLLGMRESRSNHGYQVEKSGR